eukprot:Polyplicarium_translucidae@DN2111_c0_g1_i1.p1
MSMRNRRASQGHLRLPKPPLPPMLTSGQPGTWAHDTVTRRMTQELLPRLEEQNRAFLDLFPDAQKRLQALREELNDCAASEFPIAMDVAICEAAGDTDVWRDVFNVARRELEWSAGGREEPILSWLSCNWLTTEFYFYRRIVCAFGFHLNGYDCFAAEKRAGLLAAMQDPLLHGHAASNAAAIQSAAGGTKLQREALHGALTRALWEAKEKSHDEPQTPPRPATGCDAAILDDHRDAAVEFIAKRGKDGVIVAFFTDNAGFELANDLMLVDTILSLSGERSKVVLFVKTEPLYVSDATRRDFLETLRAFETGRCVEGCDGFTCERVVPVDEELKRLSERLQEYLRKGRLTVRDEAFTRWPLAYWDMPVKLSTQLAVCDLCIVKGDANYRRLLGDRDWSVRTPWEDIVCYFPTSLLALRTVKAELCCGLREGQAEALSVADPYWMRNGSRAVVQFFERLRV